MCGGKLRPDIVWFGDVLNMQTGNKTCKLSSLADLFVSIGTSGEVWPAASIPYYAKENGALMIEITLKRQWYPICMMSISVNHPLKHCWDYF